MPCVTITKEWRRILSQLSKLAKEHVFAVGDPWFYNEYVDGRKLPARLWKIIKAAEDLVQMAIKPVAVKK